MIGVKSLGKRSQSGRGLVEIQMPVESQCHPMYDVNEVKMRNRSLLKGHRAVLLWKQANDHEKQEHSKGSTNLHTFADHIPRAAKGEFSAPTLSSPTASPTRRYLPAKSPPRSRPSSCYILRLGAPVKQHATALPKRPSSKQHQVRVYSVFPSSSTSPSHLGFPCRRPCSSARTPVLLYSHPRAPS